MNIYNVFKSKSKIFYSFLVLLGIVNSITYTGLLILINNSISNHTLFDNAKYNAPLFFGVIVISAICSKIFQYYVVKLTNDILFKFEMEVLEKLRHAEFEAFEQLGVEKVFTAISDTRVLGKIPETFINAFNSAIIVLCCMGYMFINSPIGGVFILGVIVFLLLVYLKRNKGIETELNKLRDLQNDYYRYLNDMLQGFKEIKMGLKRSENIFNTCLRTNRVTGKRLGETTAIKYLDNELMGRYSWYIILGLVMYLLPVITDVKTGMVSTFIVTILYLIGPVGTLITLVPFYTSVKIAMERLKKYEDTMSTITERDISYNSALDFNGDFQSLRFEQLTYEYAAKESEKPFVVGPINLEIRKGEVIFIVGGNGSGKSTFIHLLTGLYKPVAGHIYYNENKILLENYPYYSNKLSVIFTQNHLFNENYDEFNLSSSNPTLRAHIGEMQLSKIVVFDDDNNRIHHELSKGQQKRLAMVYALMEERDVLVLDEWAAEQDPVFRAYFYKVFLKKLRAMGKTIIAVTHDDAYFSCADRILKFDYGNICYDRQTNGDIVVAEGSELLIPFLT
ncbi:cyclic peptide export ABC transporter [Chryseolinea lacunae]|uniref:Cyclic peptide export ABC transporter n=1 Tax=Chryseolinea lacunae TaxID=2801331 RepID=A0ABS1KUD4_9BACT|nr:cyclic peptide export ABC transporter [Chryseolinea lacunae]MBL0743055.1 cyclic peptide export ABC transporter [Chryseolinea lacunae]